MEEMRYHPAYELIKKLCSRGSGNNIAIDYVILQNDEAQPDKECHRRAAVAAMQIISERHRARYNLSFTIAEENMWGDTCSADKLIADKINIRYESAFLNPPYGSDLTKADFNHINNMLFSAPKNLEVYDWCSGIDWSTPDPHWGNKWSDYFDDGLEWWGVLFFTAYDSATNLSIIIAASATD